MPSVHFSAGRRTRSAKGLRGALGWRVVSNTGWKLHSCACRQQLTSLMLACVVHALSETCKAGKQAGKQQQHRQSQVCVMHTSPLLAGAVL